MRAASTLARVLGYLRRSAVGAVGVAQSILPDDPDLVEADRLFGLEI